MVLCRSGNHSIFTVEVSESAPTLKVVSVFTSALEPYPAEITQNENQYVRYTDSHYFYSPYKTETQKTTFKLASSSIESFTKLAPFNTKGSSIIFGSYKDVEAYEVSCRSVGILEIKASAGVSCDCPLHEQLPHGQVLVCHS